MADKKISELDLALLINDDAEFPFSQDNAGEPTTFKGRITQLGTKIAEDMTFSNLGTTSKKLVGAINELLSLGSPIIIGTTAPTSSIGADGNLYIQYTAGTGGADDEVDGIFVKINGAWCEIQTGGGSGTTDYEDLSNKPQVNSVELVGNKSLDDLGIMPASLSKTVSGSIVHITDGADNIPVKALVSQIVAVESGSGEKSPENPFTISGFSQADIVVRASKNFFDKTTVTNGYRIGADGNPFPQEGYSISDWIETVPNIPIVANVTFSAYDGLTFYDSSKTFIERITSGTTVRVPTNAKYIRVAVNNSYLNTYQLQYGTTSTTYEAYSDTINTYTFAFGQTVYGGHFDNKGNLVVTHKKELLSSLSFNVVNQHYFYADISDLLVNSSDMLCEIYKTMSPYSGYNESNFDNKSISISQLSKRIAIRDDNYSDVVSFTNSLNGYYVNYPLENPIILSITSQDIPTLLGVNNIYSNTGDVEVNYYTDNADEIVEVAKATASTPLHNYSTDEQIVGTWIDGSTLYQKSFVFTSSLTITDDWVSTPFSISGLDKIIDGIIWRVSSGGSVYIDTNVDGDNIRISTKSKNTNFAIGSVLTIRYTKSST